MLRIIWLLLIFVGYNNSFGMITIYSHGYGEMGPQDTAYSVDGYDDLQARGPVYTDNNSLYTRPAVIKLADYLYKQVELGEQSIRLVGRSCGSGVIINMLAKLIDYDKDPSYFKNSCIASKQDAQVILQAINNGQLELTVPLLSIEKTALVDSASKKLSRVSVLLGCVMATPQSTYAYIPAACLAACAFYSGFDCALKRVYATLIDRMIAPYMFKDYDAWHLKPIDALKSLKGKLKCPTLIQVCKRDGVLENSPHDIAQLYKALRKDNKVNTRIFVSDDAGHNTRSYSYMKFKQSLDKNDPMPVCELIKKLT